jgi:hypothetical protein
MVFKAKHCLARCPLTSSQRCLFVPIKEWILSLATIDFCWNLTCIPLPYLPSHFDKPSRHGEDIMGSSYLNQTFNLGENICNIHWQLRVVLPPFVHHPRAKERSISVVSRIMESCISRLPKPLRVHIQIVETVPHVLFAIWT